MRKKTVLVVDDTPDYLELMRTLIETAQLPVNVLTAGNGLQALSVARRVEPALVLMDLSMPVLDGFEATRRLKADPATRRIPVVVVSGRATPDDRERAFESGCEAYLTKPIDILTFIALLRRHLA